MHLICVSHTPNLQCFQYCILDSLPKRPYSTPHLLLHTNSPLRLSTPSIIRSATTHCPIGAPPRLHIQGFIGNPITCRSNLSPLLIATHIYLIALGNVTGIPQGIRSHLRTCTQRYTQTCTWGMGSTVGRQVTTRRATHCGSTHRLA